jgi:hypothetical protein
MPSFELDHVFIYTSMGASEAEVLKDLGLTEGPANDHPGQGTANRRFFFHNAMLELLWVHDPAQAQNVHTRPTCLWERWRGRQRDTSPFGICLRPQYAATAALPFPSWAYQPAYLSAPWVIHVGDNATVLTEPLLFYVAFGRRPDQAGSPYPITHATGFREITALRVQGPQPTRPSAVLQAVMDTGVVTWCPGPQYHMDIGFDGEAHNKVIDLRPTLPLTLSW